VDLIICKSLFALGSGIGAAYFGRLASRVPRMSFERWAGWAIAVLFAAGSAAEALRAARLALALAGGRLEVLP
jgi:hypothetical protein